MGNPNSRKPKESGSMGWAPLMQQLDKIDKTKGKSKKIYQRAEDVIAPFPKFEPHMIQDSFPRFLELPSNIRDKIYLYAWDQTRVQHEDSRLAVVVRGLDRIIPRALNPIFRPEHVKNHLRGYNILFASKQTYKEATAVVFGDLTLSVVFNLRVYDNPGHRGIGVLITDTLKELREDIQEHASSFVIVIKFPSKKEQRTSRDPRDAETKKKNAQQFWPITYEFAAVRELVTVLSEFTALSKLDVILNTDGEMNENEVGFAIPFYDLPFTGWRLLWQRNSNKPRLMSQEWLDHLTARVAEARRNCLKATTDRGKNAR